MFKKIKDLIKDVLFPKKCVGCGREGTYICKDCSLFLSEAPNLFMAGNLEQLVSIWEYEGLVKKLIYYIKYKGAFDIIDELVEKAFEIREPKIVLSPGKHKPEEITITFVPMFKKKKKQRGFNQAEVIAKKVGEIINREVVPLLEKIKDTPSQTALNKEERMENVKGSFKRKEGVSCNDNVLLVDDVWTSGATMQECCKILKKSGVKKVFGFTLARTP
jgi:competence protein ComFC